MVVRRSAVLDACKSVIYNFKKSINQKLLLQMSRPPFENPPSIVLTSLQMLGTNLHIARRRRKETLKGFASRIGVSIPTIRKMEAGDPRVSMGVYATALWVLGRIQLLPRMVDPAFDEVALARELVRFK